MYCMKESKFSKLFYLHDTKEDNLIYMINLTFQTGK